MVVAFLDTDSVDTVSFSCRKGTIVRYCPWEFPQEMPSSHHLLARVGRCRTQIIGLLTQLHEARGSPPSTIFRRKSFTEGLFIKKLNAFRDVHWRETGKNIV